MASAEQVIGYILELSDLKFLPGQLRNGFCRWNNIFQKESVCFSFQNCFEFGCSAPEEQDLIILKFFLKGVFI